MHSAASWLKSLVLARGPRPRMVPLGVYRGLRLDIDLSSQAQLYLGLWERETYRWVARASTRCAWAIDVGAGRGELTVYLLRHSRARRIYAFEPAASDASALRRHVELNRVQADSRLVLHEAFAGTSSCSSAAIAIDSLDVDVRQRGFLKIDVDGAEVDVLESGRRLLSQGRLDVLVETHSASLEKACLELLRGWGYRCRIIRNAWWRVAVPELRPGDHNRWLWADKDHRQ